MHIIVHVLVVQYFMIVCVYLTIPNAVYGIFLPPPPAELIIQQPDKTEKRFVRNERNNVHSCVNGSASDAPDRLCRLVLDCPPYTASFNDLLKYSDAAKTVDEQRRLALLVHARMHHEVIPLNVITYNALIQLVVHCNDETIFKFYEEFKDVSLHENNSIQPDLVTFENLFRACERGSLFQRAFVLYQQMRHLFHLTPGVSVYNTLLGFCTASKDVAQATYLVSEMKQNGVELDVSTYNSFLTVLVNTAPYAEMLRLFNEMNDHNLRPTSRIFNTMLLAARAQNDYDRAFQLFEEMKKKGVIPDLTTYNHLLCMCEQRLDTIFGEGRYAHVRRSHAQRYRGARAMAELVLTLLAQMRDMAVEPNTMTYNTVLSILLRCRDHRIFDVYRDVQRAYDRYMETTALDRVSVSPHSNDATTDTQGDADIHDDPVRTTRSGSSRHGESAGATSTTESVDAARTGHPVTDSAGTDETMSAHPIPATNHGRRSRSKGKSESRRSTRSGDSTDTQRFRTAWAVTPENESEGESESDDRRRRSVTPHQSADVNAHTIDTLCLHRGAHPESSSASIATLSDSHFCGEGVIEAAVRRTSATPPPRTPSHGRCSLRESSIDADASGGGCYYAQLLASLTGESEMQVSGVRPTAEAYRYMLQAYLTKQQVDPCRELYATMRHVHKVLFDRAVATVVLEICAHLAHDRAWAESVMRAIRREGLYVDTNLYNMYLRVLAVQIGTGCAEEDAELLAVLEERFQEMKVGINEFGARANSETYNVMLDAYTRAARFSDALELFAAMREPYSSITPNDETYCCVIAVSEARRDMSIAQFIMDYMYFVCNGTQAQQQQSQQQQPSCRYDAVSLSGMGELGMSVFHRFMKLCALLDDRHHMEEVFALLRGSRHREGSHTGGGDGHDGWSGAASASVDGTSESPLPTLSNVADSASENATRQHSFVARRSYTRYTLPLMDVTCYTIMMQFYFSHDQYDHVQKLFHELKSSQHMEPDAAAYHVMFQVCAKLADRKAMANLFDDTRIQEIKLDLATYEVILQAFIPTTDPFMYRVLENMHANGVNPAESTFALFLVSNEGRQRLSDILARRMFSQPIPPVHF